MSDIEYGSGAQACACGSSNTPTSAAESGGANRPRSAHAKPNATEIADTASFLAYFEQIRERTLRVVRCIPPDKLEWTPAAGRFTLGDLVRHIATIERYVFAEGVQGKPAKYPGCGPELADGYDNVIAYITRLHKESVEIISRLTNDDLNAKGLTGAGVPITVWKLLRVLIEHEVHHRGQIYAYLGALGVATPPLLGITAEQLRARADGGLS